MDLYLYFGSTTTYMQTSKDEALSIGDHHIQPVKLSILRYIVIK